MSFFGLRFDFRNPDFAGTTMAGALRRPRSTWPSGPTASASSASCVSEHHGSADGYLPSPLAMAAGHGGAHQAACGSRIAALIAPFHDPLRLAEDIVGARPPERRPARPRRRRTATCPSEFAMFDVPRCPSGSGATTETVATLKQAWTGEPFEFRGRTVQVTSGPVRSPGGPQHHPSAAAARTGGPPGAPASPTGSCRRTAPRSGTCTGTRC